MPPSRRDFLVSGSAAALYSSRILGANDRIQVGFIGYGLMGAQHVHDFKQQPDVDLAAIKKKWKDKAFARGAKREDIERGAADLGVPLDEHIEVVLKAMQEIAPELGLRGSQP